MFEAVRSVCNQTLEFARAGQCTLENVTNIVEAYTKIDSVGFVRYDAAPENPIWGEFQRWEQFAPYEGEKTYVEIRYASHLDRSWMRFVVCKELAHSLESRRGTHSVTDEDVTSLISELSLASAAKTFSEAHTVEKIAEAAALEILFPMKLRRELLAAGKPSDETIVQWSHQHEIPILYVMLGADPGYNDIVASMFGLD